MKTKLPEKLSELILVALADLEAVERDPDYLVEMCSWHEPNGKCKVCFAGSVMARSLNAPLRKFVRPGSYDLHTESRLLALDRVRQGWVCCALKNIHESMPAGITCDNGYFEAIDYHDDP